MNRNGNLFTGAVLGSYRRGFGFNMDVEHNHTQYEISLVIQGELNVTNGEERVRVAAPCVLLHFPGSYHSVKTDPNMEYERYNIHYSAEVFHLHPTVKTDSERLFCSNFHVFAIDLDRLDEILYYVRPLIRHQGNNARQQALLAVILNLLVSCCPEEYPAGGGYSNNINVIGAVIRYISNNLSPSLSAENIASAFFISRAKLAADFKREIGMTIKQYIEMQCVERAKQALEEGNSVQETAFRIGWQNPGTFIRVFKRMTGITPGAYLHKDV